MEDKMSIGPRPRINGRMVNEFRGQSVVLLGHAKDVDQNGRFFTIQCCDDVPVKVHMNEPLSEYVSGLTEVHGKIDQSGELKCDNYILFSSETSTSFDTGLYSKAVDLMHQHPEHYIVGVQE